MEQFKEIAEKIEQMKPQHQKLKEKLIYEKYKDQLQTLEEVHEEEVDNENLAQDQQSLKDSMRED